MKYLTKLITPKNGIILDPFAGTGTTGLAAIQATNYSNDYQFHAALAKLFSQLSDAHTVYNMPKGYMQFYVCIYKI